MKCARCNRKLLSATVQIGTLALGRVCAVKLGFGRAKSARITSYRARQPTSFNERQLELDLLPCRPVSIGVYGFAAMNNVANACKVIA